MIATALQVLNFLLEGLILINLSISAEKLIPFHSLNL